MSFGLLGILLRRGGSGMVFPPSECSLVPNQNSRCSILEAWRAKAAGILTSQGFSARPSVRLPRHKAASFFSSRLMERDKMLLHSILFWWCVERVLTWHVQGRRCSLPVLWERRQWRAPFWVDCPFLPLVWVRENRESCHWDSL